MTSEAVSARAANSEQAAERLRAEFEHAQSDARRARILYELGEVQERGGLDAAAIATYISAAELDGSFVETLESALRVIERSGARGDLRRVLESLVRAASAPGERIRALTELAFHAALDRGDWQAAKNALLEATGIATDRRSSDGAPDVVALESASAWLLLEIVAAKLNDRPLRAQALAARGRYPSDPAWQALVRFDALREGTFDPAAWSIELEREEVAYVVAKEIDRIATRDPNARVLLIRALRTQQKLIAHSLDQPAQRVSFGVPVWDANLEKLIDTRLRLARLSEDEDAVWLLRDSLDRVRVRTSRDIEREGQSRLTGAERTVGFALLARLSRAGNMASLSSLAQSLLASETRPEARALLTLKLAECAAEESDASSALSWLSRATSEGAAAIVATAVEFDLLAGQQDVTRFTRRLRELAEATGVDAAKIRHLTLGAYLQITRDKNTTEARDLMERAIRAGLDPTLAERLRRMFAALSGDIESYESATHELAKLAPAAEQPLLVFEWMRASAFRADGAGTNRALQKLGEYPETLRLQRLLSVFAPFSEPTHTSIRALGQEIPSHEGATPSASSFQHSAALGAALRADSEGDPAASEEHLRAAFRDDPSDLLAASLLASMLRRRRAWTDAGDVATQAAETSLDDAMAAATHLAASLDMTDAHRGRDAMAELAKADARVPGSAVLLRGWVARFLHGAGHEGDAWPASLWAAERVEEGLRTNNASLRERGIRVLTEHEDRRTAQAGHLLEAVTTDDDAGVARALDSLARLAGDDAAISARIGAVRAMKRATGRFPVDAAEGWSRAAGALPASRLAWLVAARAAQQAPAERLALEALARDFDDETRDTLLAHAAFPNPEATSAASRLARLEVTPHDSPARESALGKLGVALGPSAHTESLTLAALHRIARGEVKSAIVLLRESLATYPGDLHALELLRVAARKAGDEPTLANACLELAKRVKESAVSARLFEHAALSFLRAHDTERAEAALFECLARDPSRVRAFEFLFRRLRDRKEHARVLPLLETQIPLTDDPEALGRLYWEKARALREMGDTEAALAALSNVTTLDPDHVGALALTSEALVKQGQFAQAAELLARLAGLAKAPVRNRITAGVAAAELFETRLGAVGRAKEVLVTLRDAGLMALPLKERLAKVAALSSDWVLATTMLLGLTDERAAPEGRIEAGRLGLAIARDRLADRALASTFAAKVLTLDPSEASALELVLEIPSSEPVAEALAGAVARAETSLVSSFQRETPSFVGVERLTKVAQALGHDALHRIAVSTLGLLDPEQPDRTRGIFREEPTSVLDATSLKTLLAPGDDGPVAELFVLLSGVLAEAFGPPLSALGVGKRDRVESRAGLAIHAEVASWVGAFSVSQFELYVGGGDADAIACVPNEPPRIVVGTGVRAPLDGRARGVLARGLLATTRGTHVVMTRDDETILAIFEVVCKKTKVKGELRRSRLTPDVERLLSKHIDRRTRAAVEPLCKRIIEERCDILAWAKAARMSLARAELIGSSDVPAVVSRLVAIAPDKLSAAALEDPRALDLVRFALSPSYLAVRNGLGLGRGTGPGRSA